MSLFASKFVNTGLRQSVRMMRAAPAVCIRPAAPISLARTLFAPARFSGAFMSARNFATTKAVSVASSDKSMVNVLKRELEEEQPDVAPELPQGFELKDTPGSTHVTLTKMNNNEKMEIRFEIPPPKWENEEDYMQENENEEEQQEENQDDNWNMDSIGFKVTLTRGTGDKTFSVVFDCGTTGIEEDPFAIRGISFPDAKALNDTAESEWTRLSLYQGPSLPQLPEDMFDQVTQLLVSRGVDGRLMEFLAEYAIYKEQNEYVSWLKNMRKFLEA